MTGEAAIRLAVFVGVLGGMALAEALRPKRRRELHRGRRWPGNLALVGIGAVAMRVAAPAGAVTAAVLAESRGWGLLHAWPQPTAVAWVGSIVVLDLLVYAQHVAMHKVPWLWPLHRVHHADVDVDVTTGVRFHPLEYLLSLGLKGIATVAIGAPVGAVILFEVLLNATSMFNHANLALPAPVDRVLRLLVVTPDMHRVHHSVDRREADHNYGFNVPWWDRLFGTYRDQPTEPHETMTLGVSHFRSADDQRLDRLLVQPFKDA
ncbi:sterol desaturase family protein [Luteitalea sp.]|uniref:sterol desaturase family protein n=1 Tax=Luteitalea sp. TaxID=2004800 RepID=UPI000B1F786B|nr:sterol desaturase family protein [Luteitalea sp.]